MQPARGRSRFRILFDAIKGVMILAICVVFTLFLFFIGKVISFVAYVTYVDREEGEYAAKGELVWK